MTPISKDPKTIVEEVFTPAIAKKLWTSIYSPILPVTPQDFTLGSVLPAMLYMFRFGQRRGKGSFVETFSKADQKSVSVEDVVDKLIQETSWFQTNQEPVERVILGDVLLNFCLENKKRVNGHTAQVQRVYPVHYLSSWLDLPIKVADLRAVPEMLVAILANQTEGSTITETKHRSWYGVARGFEENVLLSHFGESMKVKGQFISSLTSDHLDEEAGVSLGLDQIMMIRIAQSCGQAPEKARGGEVSAIPNQLPIASRAPEILREDFNVFIQVYGSHIPRQAFLEMLESCFALGLTTILLSSSQMVLEWERNGRLPDQSEEKSWPLFVDCSSGVSHSLRKISEESVLDTQRRYERVTIVLMCMRILDVYVKNSRHFRNEIPHEYPRATEWINLLGEVFIETHPKSTSIIDNIDALCINLADSLQDNDLEPGIQSSLRDGRRNPVVRLAEALCKLMGPNLQEKHLSKFLDCCFMCDSSAPNALAVKRRATQQIDGRRRSFDARSIIMSNTTLDYLIHRHLRKGAKGKPSVSLTFSEFVDLLRSRYGLYIDQEPPGMSIPNELLTSNRNFLERRLRDMGLLVGVNDAESMKYLRQRFGDKDDYASI